jgi:7,8-dihydropterin-6-yl-methyl-4-(beta-D-ribofuranosyl)aminobenzene 5'-phosphate synthase
MQGMTISVIYDNNPFKKGLATGWGFSAIVGGAEKPILFDSGRDAGFLENMERLGMQPQSIEVVVLSHSHPDHTGGMESFLQKNPDVPVYVPRGFSKKRKTELQSCGAKLVEVDRPVEMCEGVWSTGRTGTWIKEHALLVLGETGAVLLTGCAHPGIVKMVRTAKGLVKDDVSVVLGGFHSEWTSGRRIENVIAALKDLGVRYAGPCHCSGEKARALFEKHFGKNYIEIGAGKTVEI